MLELMKNNLAQKAENNDMVQHTEVNRKYQEIQLIKSGQRKPRVFVVPHQLIKKYETIDNSEININ